jgi:hypothetical protein
MAMTAVLILAAAALLSVVLARVCPPDLGRSWWSPKPDQSSPKPILLAGCACVAVGALMVFMDRGRAGALRIAVGSIVCCGGVLLIVLGEIERHRRPDDARHAGCFERDTCVDGCGGDRSSGGAA